MTGMTTRGRGRWDLRRLPAVGAAVVIAGLVMTVALPTVAGAGTKLSHRPSVPLNVTVAAAPGELVVSWSPPAYNGEYLNRLGVPKTYVITDYDLKGVPAPSWAACPDLALSCPLVGLKVGHSYSVRVKVWNALGKHSTWTAPVRFTYTG
jgi:hypothetical protein